MRPSRDTGGDEIVDFTYAYVEMCRDTAPA